MIVDLRSVEIFESDELDFDRKITFVFGKNGTGKSTITEELGKLTVDYEVSAFQGFSKVIDENRRLNAVVLGEENATISRQIEAKKAELATKEAELQAIMVTLQKPDDDSVSNFWTKRDKAEKEYKKVQKTVDDFYTYAASKIKQIDKPRVASTSYNKRNFQEDISYASQLTEEEIKQYKETIKSEVKEAPSVVFPAVDFQVLRENTNRILAKTVVEKVKIKRLEDDAGKREFARTGLKIHKKGEVCAFCGNKIEDSAWDELVSYFSADEVKAFQGEIQKQIDEIDLIIEQVSDLCFDKNCFYPSYKNDVNEIGVELEKKKKAMLSYLNLLRKSLDDKLKYLFEVRAVIDEIFSDSLVDIEQKYETLRKDNNQNDLVKKQKEAMDYIRRHYVKLLLDESEYDNKLLELKTQEESKRLRTEEFDAENLKIIGPNGLNEKIKAIRDEINRLQNDTKNEGLLADNINRKLKHMVSFELVHVEDEESKGFYRVKNSKTGVEREITELSTGEKNIIAFLYFIEKLDEIKDNPVNKPRIIIFDDPMSSNDDGMQYLIIEELQKLMKRLLPTDHFILLTHNKHFYLNVKYGHYYNKDRFIRFQSDGRKTHFIVLENKKDDYKTSYESLWGELKQLYSISTVSADLLLNPIRRIIETYTKFNAIEKDDFCSPVYGAMKLFNVNSHSIDDVEAELNGKSKNDIIQMFFDCFNENGKAEHFKKFWSELEINENGEIVFES